MLLEHCSWPEVEAYLARSTGILVPVGSVEQHGPTGLLGTDALCAEAVAREAGARAGLLVAPALRLGVAHYHLGFPGTLSLRPATLIALVEDLASSLARHGFTHLMLVNGHGGNLATLAAAAQAVLDPASRAAAPSALHLKVASWWDPPPVRALIKELFGEEEGSHATASEISLTRFLLPELVKKAALDPPRAPAGSGFRDAADFRRRYPDGRIGSNPGRASPEAGRQIFEAAVLGLLATWQGFSGQAQSRT